MAYRSGITENVSTVILPKTFSQISGIVNRAAFPDRVTKVGLRYMAWAGLVGGARHVNSIASGYNMASNCEILCCGCGQDITDCPSNRYNMLGSACATALPVWSEMVAEIFEEMEVQIDLNEFLGSGGKCMCRKCPTRLVRLHKMALDAKAKLRDAVEKIIDLRPPARKNI